MSKALNTTLKHFIANLSDDELFELGLSRNSASLKNSPQNLEIKISNILQDLGVPAHIKGYPYLISAISTVLIEPSYIGSVTSKLYPTVADKFDTTPTRAERAMRHAIDAAWTRGNTKYCDKLFATTITKGTTKPTNSEFIAMIADHIRLGKL